MQGGRGEGGGREEGREGGERTGGDANISRVSLVISNISQMCKSVIEAVRDGER